MRTQSGLSMRTWTVLTVEVEVVEVVEEMVEMVEIMIGISSFHLINMQSLANILIQLKMILKGQKELEGSAGL